MHTYIKHGLCLKLSVKLAIVSGMNVHKITKYPAMSTSEKFCLKWNDFQENVSSTFGSLREDNEFADVTLACEDGQKVEAHKVILAASSPFFQNLFRHNKHAHPMIYMRGVEFNNLNAIVDFLYYGEANIYQENLDNFLNIAGELKLKGLDGEVSNSIPDDPNLKEHGVDESVAHESKMFGNPLIITSNQNSIKQKKISLNMQVEKTENQDHSERAVALSGDVQELDKKVMSMILLGQNMLASGKQKASVCQVCGKEGQTSLIKDHIEANHLEGIAIPCNLCEKTFRSRRSLRNHKQHQH